MNKSCIRPTARGSGAAIHDLLILLLKGLAGGALVVAFALVSEGLSPKRFAGLFGAAPAVALAGLTIVLLDKGAHDARENSIGMIAGGVGMVACAAAAVRLLQRTGPKRAATLAIGVWALVAGVVAIPILAT